MATTRRLGSSLAAAAEEQVSRAVAHYRLELRRVASVLALSLAAAMLAFAVAFAALALAAGVLVRRRTAA